MPRPPPRSPLFPYTTLFRSEQPSGLCQGLRIVGQGAEVALYFSQRRVPVAALLVEGADRQPPLDPRRRKKDRKSTRLNSSHLVISYAVFCLKKKKQYQHPLP